MIKHKHTKLNQLNRKIIFLLGSLCVLFSSFSYSQVHGVSYSVGKVVTGTAATTYTVPYTITPADTVGSTFTRNTTGGGTITLGNGQTLTVSSLPTTVQDAAGTVYQADDKGKLTKVGTNSSNAGAMLATANLTVVDASKGTVTFAPTSDMKYAFDAWQKAYDGNSNWSKRYETLPISGQSGKYRVSSKLMVPGEADKVLAIINLNDKSLVADSVRFANVKGTLFEKKKITDNSCELSLVGGPAGDAQEVYALYSTGGKTYTMGKLLVATYEPKTINLALVPVNGAKLNSEAIAEELKKVYEPLGIDFNLTTKDKFEYEALKTASLKVEGSGLLSVYTDQMKALNAAFVASGGYDKNTIYLFAIDQPESQDGKSIEGVMPRGQQFGYLFVQGKNDDAQGLTAAHEIGHGVFQLQHAFDYSGIKQKAITPLNVMDYPAGEALSKLQWDLMHDPGLVISVFETDKGAESFTNVLPEQKDGVMYRLDKAMNFVSPSGKIVQLPTDALVKFYCIDINSCQTQGLLIGFVINNKEYVARYSDIQNPNGVFNGYFEKVNGKISNNPYINAYAPLTVGKNKISFIQEDYLDNGETRIRIITEEQTINQENIEKKGGIFVGRKYHPFSYNSQITVAGTEEKVFASNCDNNTKNSQTIGNGSCIIKLKKVGDKWQVDTVVLDDSKANSKTKDQKTKIEAMLKQLAVEKLNELGLEGKTSAKISTETEDDGEFYVKEMTGREWLTTLAHLGENVWENAALPEDYWNKDKGYNDKKATIHIPPTFAGVGDGVVDQLTQYPQLIKLGYDVATKEEVRTGIWNAVKNITPNGAISMIKNAVKNKVEEYNFSDKPWKGYHAVGKDGVTVLTMLTGVGLVKDGEKAVENGASETGETIRRNAINDVENEAVQLSKEVIELSEKNITNSGVTVLGDYIPNGGYIKKAQDMGASYFDIGNKWDVLSDAERKAANFHFLDVIADKGDQIIMSIEKSKILGSSTQKEIEYLTTKKGYKWVNQWSLKK